VQHGRVAPALMLNLRRDVDAGQPAACRDRVEQEGAFAGRYAVEPLAARGLQRGEGVPGEYQWVEEEYECEETYISHYETETYTVEVPVYETEVYYVDVPVYETQQEERTREVPIYETETYTVEVPVYDTREVEVERDFPIYEERTYTYTTMEFFWHEYVSTTYKDVPETGGTMFIDGRVTSLYGDLNGRLTIVANENIGSAGLGVSVITTDSPGARPTSVPT